MRQPVHTVYGGAHLFRADVADKLGAVARRELRTYAPDAAALAAVVGELPPTVYERVVEKLEREPVEDYRIDFEDGYGVRSDAEEDGHAAAAARELENAERLPASLGVRLKPVRDRALRTLEPFLEARRPEDLIVTLPKVMAPEQVAAFADLPVKLEIMVETPQALLRLRELLDAARGRLIGAHFGPYDFTASLGVTAAHQSMLHPACDFARHTMQVALAGAGVWLSDGPTNVLPVPVERGVVSEANRAAVHRGWRLHYEHVRHSLRLGFYQGWDVHPAQLVTRYAAVYAFFREGLEAASQRLRRFLAAAAQATRVGQVFDDAATGRGLLNYFERAVACGALSEEEAAAASGMPANALWRRFEDPPGTHVLSQRMGLGREPDLESYKQSRKS